jgi:hypothetical protein
VKQARDALSDAARRYSMQSSSVSSLIISLESSSEVLKNFVDGIPEEDIIAHRRPDVWSIRHHVFHLAGTQEVMYGRIVQFRRDKHPVIVPFNPGDSDTGVTTYRSVADAMSVFHIWREKQIDEIKILEESDLYNPGTHPEYRRYDLMILIRHILMHDYWHMYRIEELWLLKDEFLSAV